MSDDVFGQPKKRKRGRPRAKYALVGVMVRLHPKVYDAHCRTSLRRGVPLAQVLRAVLTRHAPGRMAPSKPDPKKS